MLHPFSGVRIASYFSDRCVTTCIRVGLSQTKNGFDCCLALSINAKALSRMTSSTVFHVVLDVWHRVRRQRAFVDNFLLADLAPAWVDRRIVNIAGHGGHQVARPDFIQESRWVVAMERVLHRIEMIQIAPELVEPVDRRQELVEVAQMVFAELAGRVSHRFESVCDGDGLIGDAEWCSGLSDRRKASAKWQFAGDEVRPSGSATRLRI